MSDINILSPHIADLIAAGEVVERPASVIKELLENAFDAGARNISIELRDGGLTYIRITDDGMGMLPEDAGLCFLRHATSKLTDARGLERIGTLGFRGEALAAISAVSRIELLTRRKGEEVGTRILLEAGDIQEMTAYGCPEGTTMIVRDLFFNTPARLKFMKSDRAESSACINTALRCALGRPQTSVRFMRDGKEEFFSPGDGKEISCVYSLLGRDISKSFINCVSNDESVSVTGFVSSPANGHGNRGKQFFFCNGRFIRSLTLQAAVEQAYKNTLLSGRFPACVLWLTISPARVDVNVHPTKIEIKFQEVSRVFDAVYYATRSAIQGENRNPAIALDPSTKAAITPKKDFFQSMSASEYRQKQSPAPDWYRPPTPSKMTVLRDTGVPFDTGRISPPPPPQNPANAPKTKANLVGIELHIDPPIQQSLNIPAYRLIGEAMKTYIILEVGENLLLIDKHAAHERLIFDRLKMQKHEIMSQTLLIPVTVKLSPHHAELIEQNREKLDKLGLEIEPFGDDGVILRAVPAETDASDAVALVEELCEKLDRGADVSAEDMTDEILHTIACTAAIKAGWNTTNSELLSIADEVVSGRIKYCPHGRPIAVTMSKKQLDKEFSRIV